MMTTAEFEQPFEEQEIDLHPDRRHCSACDDWMLDETCPQCGTPTTAFAKMEAEWRRVERGEPATHVPDLAKE